MPVKAALGPLSAPFDPRVLFATRPAAAERTADQLLREQADRQEISDLVALYAHRVTHGLSNADLFTDDGAYIHRRSPDAEAEVTCGREELDAHYVERPGAAGVATPMIHNLLINLAGDEADGICSIELSLWHGGQRSLASGYYRDSFRRENGRWKFVVRDVVFFHWEASAPD